MTLRRPWTHEHDTGTREDILKGRKSKKRPVPRTLADDPEIGKRLAEYPDTADYKCPLCGRAKPCRYHQER